MKLKSFFLSIIFIFISQWTYAQSSCRNLFFADVNISLHKFERTGIASRNAVVEKLRLQDEKWEQIFTETEFLPWSVTYLSHSKNEVFATASGYSFLKNVPFLNNGKPDSRPLNELSKIDLERWTSADVIKALQRSNTLDRKFSAEPKSQQQFESLLRWLVNQRNQVDPSSDHSLNVYLDHVAHVTQSILREKTFGPATEVSVQILMASALKPLGILAPRVDNFQQALSLNTADWAKVLKDGINSHENLVSDISARLRYGLKLENSPWIRFAQIPTKIVADLKLPSRDDTIPGSKIVEVDPGQFVTFFDFILQKEADLNQKMAQNPAAGVVLIKDRYQKFIKSTHLEYKHDKNGLEDIALNLVDKDFVNLFGVSTHRDASLYAYKMNRWYEADVVWRGWSHLEKVIPEAELLQMFTTGSAQMVSNRLLGLAYSGARPEQLVAAAKSTFDIYNKELIEGEAFYQMMKDHHQEGKLYYSSYGFSTSKNWTVGRAFAMGAMKVADYGQQHLHQDKLKSRILIGVRQAKKDVDQGRLRQFNKSYQYIYGRQQEITGISMAEPDSLVIIQRISAEGSVEMTYLRDEQNPNVILKIEGDYRPQRGDDLKNFALTKIHL